MDAPYRRTSTWARRYSSKARASLMGRSASRWSSDAESVTCRALTIARETRSCTSKTSSIVPLYLSAHSCSSVVVSVSWAVMRSALPAFRALPVRTYRTPSVWPISRIPLVVPLSCSDDAREITRSAFTPDRSVMSSSVSPSLKYSFSGSVLRLVKGSTAIDVSRRARSGARAAGAAGAVAWARNAATTWAPVLIPLVRRTLEEPRHRVGDDGRHLRARVGDGGRRVGEALGDDGVQRRAGERGLARQHLVHHAAEREEVAAAVHVVAGRLFGAHVRGRADGQADLGEGRAGGRRGDQRLADAEVGHDRVAFVQQDVLGLDVAMDDVVAVRVVERVGHLDGDAQRVVDRHGGAVREAVTQRLPLHHRHDEVEVSRPLLPSRRGAGCADGSGVRRAESPGESARGRATPRSRAAAP